MSDLAIISIEKKLDPIREKNLFYNTIVASFIWMVFHFTVIYFFTFQLNSIAWVWIFLWIWNFIAFLIDISLWIIQKYYKSKTLFIWSYIFEIFAMIIFAYFVFQADLFWHLPPNSDIWTFTSLFLSKWMNITLIFIASLLYWIVKELQEVTLYSYILNNSDNSEYNKVLSNKNLASWIWSLLWLILSWIILTFSPKWIVILIILMIILIIFFTKNFYDNSEKTIDFWNITNFKVKFKQDEIKNSIIKSVNKIELKDIISKTKYVFVKPPTKNKWLSLLMLFEETKREFVSTYKIFMNNNKNLVVYWSLSMVMIFGFWDNFAATFLLDFLDELKNWWAYALLAIIAIPAYTLQNFFCKLADKYSIYTISNLWLILSWSSLLIMWLFSESRNVIFVMILALLNSLWYAASMALSQATFLESYNKAFAVHNNLNEIDSNASAAPLKIVWNLANVIWLAVWGIILSLLDFKWFFILFGGIILYVFYWTVKNKINYIKKDGK